MPRWLTQAGLRLRTLFQRDRVERELDEELRYHLEREIDERLSAGLTISEARLEARRSMGAIVQHMEECRDLRQLNFIEHRIQDLRFAIRQLRKHSGFACTAIGMLALGIAANVAIFGFVDATLIRPLPYTDPSRPVLVYAWLVGVGTAVGMVFAVASATLMRRLLFGVQSWDAPTLATAATVLIVSALLASYFPARRAASVNPIRALRAE